MTAWEAIREAPRRLSAAVDSSRPTLRGIASPPRRMAAVPFAVVVVVLLGIGMVGLLFLNTFLQNQAFDVRDAQRKANVLGYRVSDLEAQVTRAQSPARLAAEATELGMVPNPNGVFIDLTTGRIVGEATPVQGNEIPALQVQYPAASATPAPDAATPASEAEASAPPQDGAEAAPAPETPQTGADGDGQPAVTADAAPEDAATTPLTPAQRAASLGGTP